MTAYRVVVCGSRSYTDPEPIERRLGALRAECEAAGRTLVVVHGAAKGVDRLAHAWALKAGVEAIPVPANWTADCLPSCRPGHRRLTRDPFFQGATTCPAQGNYRNQRMLDDHGPIELALAFTDKPLAKSTGTADMVRRAIAAGVAYELHEPAPTVPSLFGGEQ